jgi:hypothetical protein
LHELGRGVVNQDVVDGVFSSLWAETCVVWQNRL